MIIALVEIPLPGPKRDHDFVVEQSLAATEIFHDVPGLVTKYFLNSDQGGGGIYVFETRAAAEAWFHQGWADWMEGRFGVRPTLRYFDNPVTLQAATGQVFVDQDEVSSPWL